jgi:hypothetical protein
MNKSIKIGYAIMVLESPRSIKQELFEAFFDLEIKNLSFVISQEYI